MLHRIKVYTTHRAHWMQSDLPFIVSTLNKSKGRTVEHIDIETIKNLKPLTFVDSDGDRRISWDWFQQHISDRTDPYYNVICLHISPAHKARWGLSKDIGGSYRNDPDPKIEFWICGTDKEAKGYTFNDFTRKFLHEMAHGDTYFAGLAVENKREWVHDMDYNRKEIHKASEYIDYSAHNTMVKLKDYYQTLINIYAKIVDR